MGQEVQITLVALKARLPNIPSMHEFLEDKGWYRAEYQRNGHRLKCWTQDYMMRLILGQSYKIERLEIRLPPTNIRKTRKDELLEEINKLCGETKLNFPEEYPPKQWLRNVLYSLNPEHRAFEKPGARDIGLPRRT